MAMMTSGSMFTAYSLVGNEPVKQTIFLFYHKDTGPKKKGVLYWSDPQNRVFSEENSLNLVDLNGVDVGKQDPVFQTPIADAADWNKCMTILSKGHKNDLHLEAVAPKMISAWLEGINSIKG